MSGRRALPLALAILLAGAAHIFYMHVMYDDAFISYRYAENLARGIGLVYNPGERVEGYSNFLWTVLMALVVRLGGRPEDVGPMVSAVLALATLGLVMFAAWRRGIHPVFAGVLVAASSAWATWATGGLETALFAFCLTFGAVGLLFALERGVGSLRWLLLSALGFGLGCLTRPDGPLPAACAAVFVLWQMRRGRLPRQSVLAWFGVLVMLVLPHLVWRLAYYGRLLPNTFAVKPPGVARLDFGVGYLANAARDLHLWVLAIPIVGALVARARPRGLEGRDLALLAAIVVPFTLYIATTGGDFMPVYRFVAPLIPLVSLVAAATLEGLADRLRARRLAPIGAAAILVVTWVYVGLNVWHSWRQQGIWAKGELVSVGWARREVDDWLRIGDLLRTVASPTDTLATTAAGAVPYRSRLYTIDMLGLNAQDLSHYRRLANQRPGHMIELEEAAIVERPPQILLGHPMVRAEPARLEFSLDLEPEWRDRVLSRYEVVGMTLLGQPVRWLGCALRKDVVDRIIAAGKRAQEAQPPGRSH